VVFLTIVRIVGAAQCFADRELVEVLEGNHDELTYFDGDQLCRMCADSAAVAY